MSTLRVLIDAEPGPGRAFAYALVQGWPLERALPFANAAAGLDCRHLGGLAGIPSLAEVLRTAGLEPPPPASA